MVTREWRGWSVRGSRSCCWRTARARPAPSIGWSTSGTPNFVVSLAGSCSPGGALMACPRHDRAGARGLLQARRRHSCDVARPRALSGGGGVRDATGHRRSRAGPTIAESRRGSTARAARRPQGRGSSRRGQHSHRPRGARTSGRHRRTDAAHRRVPFLYRILRGGDRRSAVGQDRQARVASRESVVAFCDREPLVPGSSRRRPSQDLPIYTRGAPVPDTAGRAFDRLQRGPAVPDRARPLRISMPSSRTDRPTRLGAVL